MHDDVSVNLGNLLLSLSDALDMASPELAAHQQRVAFTAWQLCKTAGLSPPATGQLFAAGLLHDIGALTPAEKLKIRQGTLANLSRHCAFGDTIINEIPVIAAAAPIIRHHHRRWRDWSEPITNPAVLQAQILALADLTERSIRRDLYILHQNERIVATIEAARGDLFHPEVVDLFREACRREEFWLDLTSPRLYSLLLNYGPFRREEVEFEHLFSFADLFRVIIDFRSPFTATHSSGIASSASTLAALFGFTETEVALMEVAGFLHDLGKLSVPNEILEKPGKLDAAEFAVMRRHTYHTYMILKSIGGLEQIAEWGAYHHERLDGSGYPFHLTARDLSLGARILTVADIFTALAEDRPYRPGMTREQIEKIITGQANQGKLDRRVVQTLFDHYDEVLGPMRVKQAEAGHFYETRFAARLREEPE